MSETGMPPETAAEAGRAFMAEIRAALSLPTLPLPTVMRSDAAGWALMAGRWAARSSRPWQPRWATVFT